MINNNKHWPFRNITYIFVTFIHLIHPEQQQRTTIYEGINESCKLQELFKHWTFGINIHILNPDFKEKANVCFVFKVFVEVSVLFIYQVTERRETLTRSFDPKNDFLLSLTLDFSSGTLVWKSKTSFYGFVTVKVKEWD